MYLYEFNDENIVIESVSNLISINEREYELNIILTDKNILLFKNIKNDSVLAGREIHEMPEYELLIKLSINDLNYQIDDNNTIIRHENNEIILFNFDLKKALNK